MPTQSGQGTDECARLLLVDGDAASTRAIVRELAEALPAETSLLQARCGRDAADLLRMQAFDIVLVDLASTDDLAPRSDDAIGKLVRMSSGALIVALSADRSVSATVAAMRAGAHDFVAKPLSGDGLAGRLGELARRHGKAPALATYGAPPDFTDAGDASGALSARLQSVAASLRAAAGEQPSMTPSVLPMWRHEQRIIEDAIATFGGNIALAAAALELSPSTLYRKRQAWADLEGKRGAA